MSDQKNRQQAPTSYYAQQDLVVDGKQIPRGTKVADIYLDERIDPFRLLTGLQTNRIGTEPPEQSRDQSRESSA